MIRSACKRLPLATIASSIIILSTLLAACSTQTPKASSTPSATALHDTTCVQPAPEPGKVTLSGLAYSPAHMGQDPSVGVFPSSEEIQADMPTLASLTHYIRTYSSTGPAASIIQAAAAANICVASGIWLGSDPAANAGEMAAGEQLAANSAVHSIIVGNEVLQRGDLSANQLSADIKQVRARLTRAVPITMADTYEEWLTYPILAEDVNFITVHIYPFWQGIPVDSAIQFVDKTYQRLKVTFPGKPIVIGETGWPSAGPSYGAAVPGEENQARYLKDFTSWAQAKKVQYFYFDAFDEDWKIHEMGVGTHWGLYQQDGQVKPTLSDLLPGPAAATLVQRGYRDVYVGGLESGFGLGIDSSGQQRRWLTSNAASLVLNYPANQQWGVMFITIGPAVPPGHRPSLDLRGYHALTVDLRAAITGQCIHIGIKDNRQPDNGSEVSVQRCLSTQWSTITLPLSMFAKVDLSHVYVVFELLFQGSSSISVDARNIRYSPK